MIILCFLCSLLCSAAYINLVNALPTMTVHVRITRGTSLGEEAISHNSHFVRSFGRHLGGVLTIVFASLGDQVQES